jgi:hypothetical protein
MLLAGRRYPRNARRCGGTGERNVALPASSPAHARSLCVGELPALLLQGLAEGEKVSLTCHSRMSRPSETRPVAESQDAPRRGGRVHSRVSEFRQRPEARSVQRPPLDAVGGPLVLIRAGDDCKTKDCNAPALPRVVAAAFASGVGLGNLELRGLGGWGWGGEGRQLRRPSRSGSRLRCRGSQGGRQHNRHLPRRKAGRRTSRPHADRGAAGGGSGHPADETSVSAHQPVGLHLTQPPCPCVKHEGGNVGCEDLIGSEMPFASTASRIVPRWW